jgi:hypothetical protein
MEINIRTRKNSARSGRFTTSQQSRYTLDMNSAIHVNVSASLCEVLSLLKEHTAKIYICSFFVVTPYSLVGASSGFYPFSFSSGSE